MSDKEKDKTIDQWKDIVPLIQSYERQRIIELLSENRQSIPADHMDNPHTLGVID